MFEERGCVLSESPKPNAETGHMRGPHWKESRARKAEDSARSVPRSLRNDAKAARGGIPRAGRQLDTVSPSSRLSL